MNILERYELIAIPTDNVELARLIYDYSMDWAVCLDWIVEVAKTRGITVNRHEIFNIIIEKIEEGE
jgi:hypothetical protein